MFVFLEVIDVQTNQIHNLDYDILQTILQSCLVYEPLIWVQVHREDTILC